MAKKRQKRHHTKKTLNKWQKCRRFVIRMLLFLFLLSIGQVFLFKYVRVPMTPLVLKRSIQQMIKGEMPHYSKKWIHLDNIASSIQYAVIASEDNLFLEHPGFSTRAIANAWEANKNGKHIIGGSTITQQTAKNVFTFGSRTWFRKGVEFYYTLLIEWIWGKQRIMEVYLNVIEMGPNIYGIDAASDIYFNCEASELSNRQSALITAVLPAPNTYSVKKPGRYVRRRVRQIQNLMPKMKRIPWLETKKR